jgi:hypothetical protein
MKNSSIFQNRIEVEVFGEQWVYESGSFAKLIDGCWLHQFTMSVRRANAQKIHDTIVERKMACDSNQ